MKKALKRSLSVFLAITLVFGSVYMGLSEVDFGGVFAVKTKAATTGVTGDCTWSLEGTVLTVSGNGSMESYLWGASTPWGTGVTEIIITEGVTNISDGAFANCTSIVSVTLPDSVTSIGNYSFRGCTGLEAVILGDNVDSFGIGAFLDCTSLAEITIPDKTTSIGTNAFYNCTSLVSITLPEGITNIGSDVFYNTGYYNTASNWENNVLYLGVCLVGATVDLMGDYAIKDGTKFVLSNAFNGCNNLISITVPDSVIRLGEYAFENCTSLKAVHINDIANWCKIGFDNNSANPLCYAKNLYIDGQLATNITIPEGVARVPAYSFYNCESLVSVTMPSGVDNISFSVFCNCINLETVSLPDTLTRIENSAFENCSKINTLFVEDLSKWCSVYFGNTYSNPLLYATNVFFNGKLTKSVVIPDDVTSISSKAFYGGETLSKFTIHDNVTSIGSDAFTDTGYYNDSSNWENKVLYIDNHLIKVDTSKTDKCGVRIGTKTIADNAAYDCYDVTGVVIPETVTHIGKKAFYRNTSLTALYIIDLEKWCSVKLADSYSNPLYYAENLYINITLATDIVIPETVTSIGDYAFYRCKSINTIVIPETVTSVGKMAFYYCSATSVTAPCNLSLSTFFKDTVLTEIHNYSTEWTTDLEPTCMEDGSMSHHCLRCGDKKDVTSIDAIGHDYVLQSELSVHPHTKTYFCNNCSDIKTESPIATNCVECNFTVAEDESANVKLVSYIGNQADVIIPETYNGKKITTIEDACFRNNTEITSVKIEEGITTIGSIAFMGCSSLQRVYIPESVTSISANAFYGIAGSIYCYEGSVAHEYAEANNVSYVLLSILETENTSVDYDNYIITTTVQGATDCTELFEMSESALPIATASHMHGKMEYYGTGTIISVFNGADYMGDFTLIVKGDINGDSICDVLDAVHVARISNGQEDVDGIYVQAVDSNADDIVDVNDYQAIVNKVVS